MKRTIQILAPPFCFHPGRAGLAEALLSRLKINAKKIDELTTGLQQLSTKALTALNRPLKRTQLADGLQLTQISVPIGVLLVIFESRPDSLPQISGLSIATGNGLLLKGGSEALRTNRLLTQLIQEELGRYGASDAIALVRLSAPIAVPDAVLTDI